MKYLEWNNIIGEYFFNTDNEGKDIYLYLTKSDIINFGKERLEEKSDDEIWLDFIYAIKYGIPGSRGNIIEKAKYAHSKNNLLHVKRQDGSPLEIDGIPLVFPPYIAYLTFLVLPLIEFFDSTNHRVNNYYGRLNDFLKSHQINDAISTNDFRVNNINLLWEDLAKWANVKNHGDLGVFNVIPFINQNWVYVGKVFSQCVLPPKFLNRLPELFEYIGLVPNTFYEDRYLLEKIQNSRTDLIPKSTLSYLENNDELSNSIIQTIQRKYKGWTGEAHEEIAEGIISRKKRNVTVAPLFLQFKINTNDEEIKFSYRIYSLNEYPEDLKFDKFENLYETNGWSKTILVDFKEGLELSDYFNKWIARFPDHDVRLFLSAGSFQLSNDFWIETYTLSKTERMYLLCKNDKKALIKGWGNTFSDGDFKEAHFVGLPENYSLFWFQNPKIGLSDLPLLTLFSEKRIILVNGLNVNFRTYTNDFLPEVKILNSDGNEKVYLQYIGTEEKVFLSKILTLPNYWLLPDNTKIDVDFHIKVENENLVGYDLAYNLASPGNKAIRVDDSKLPKRDSFGRYNTMDAEQYCLGSNIVNPAKSSKRLFCPLSWVFASTNQEVKTAINNVYLQKHCGNSLSDFLSLKVKLTTEEFFKAYEFYFSKQFPITEKINLTKLKKASLNFYDYIGILDYDYETRTIVLNPPQIIFIPSEKGRKVLLIGARDSELIKSIINTAPKHNLQVEIANQFPANEKLLLPDVITIKAYGTSTENYGEGNLKLFADELHIKFTNDYYPQLALKDFSTDIAQYENSLLETNQIDYDWARYVFNPTTLNFDRSETSNFDKSFTLVKYKLNEYTYQFKLWKENRCYHIDMNWGIFITLKYYNVNVILFDSSSKKLAIPIETPLPRLLSEAIMLLSGLAPDFKEIDGKRYRVYENVIGIFSQNLFNLKLGQTAINKTL
jgi:hypothetical protein